MGRPPPSPSQFLSHCLLCEGRPPPQDGLHYVQPNLRPLFSRQEKQGQCTPMHEPLRVRVDEIKWPVRNTREDRRGHGTPSMGQSSTSVLLWPLQYWGMNAWGRLAACGLGLRSSPDFPPGRLAHCPLSPQARSRK